MDFEQQARDCLTALGDFERAYNPDTDSWVPKAAEQALVDVLEATYKAGQDSQTMVLLVSGGRLTDESLDKLTEFGRPQPKHVWEQPETITVVIPVDIAEAWVHGSDEPEIQRLIEEALERR